MRYRPATLLTFVVSLAWSAEGGGMRQTFTLDHPPSANSEMVLEVTVGALAPGQLVRVETDTGDLIGTIAPFGPAARRGGGVYSLPVAPATLRDGKLTTRVTLAEANRPPRTPTGAEVQSLRLMDVNPSH